MDLRVVFHILLKFKYLSRSGQAHICWEGLQNSKIQQNSC